MDHERRETSDALGRSTETIRNYVDGNPATGTTDTDIIQTTAYDALGRMQGSQDALGRWVSQQYDALSRVTTTIANCRTAGGAAVATGCAAFAAGVPDLNVPSTTHYDALDRPFEQVDALGHATRSSYDILGQTTATTRNYVVGAPADSDTNLTTSQTYDALGRVVSQTNVLGVVTGQSYDALGRVVTATDGELRVSRMGYDGSGGQRWSETPDGHVTVSLVDGLGRVTTTIQNYQDGVVGANEPVDQDLITQTVYDVAGRRVATIDAAGRETRFTYDLNDQLLTVTENATDGACALPPCNVTTSYAYDRAGNRLSIIDANLHTRSFVYDAADRQVAATDALNQTTAYQYDRLGRMTFKDDPRGSAYDVTYTYDGLDRPDGITATQLSGAISVGYDALGRRTRLTDGTGTTSFAYDDAGRITGVTAPSTGSVGYSYNANGQRTSLTYPDGSVIGYSYWDDGQLKDVLQGATTLASYAYDSAGRLGSVARANGAVTSYGYDAADRLTDLTTRVNATPVSQYHYTLNRQGLRTQVQETFGAAVQAQALPLRAPRDSSSAVARQRDSRAWGGSTGNPFAAQSVRSSVGDSPTEAPGNLGRTGSRGAPNLGISVRGPCLARADQACGRAVVARIDHQAVALYQRATATARPPTITPTPTNTPTVPTATRTKTNTPTVPTATRTNTPTVPTATRTNTPTVPTATRTNTPTVPTATRTNT
ncbi:MAG: hypothetical protein HGA65_00385, partial [Oscillochloris sp.]|nr:hypothetical protein [Oscillochloris sp.]